MENKTQKCGQPTQVYSRVCGYFRPVSQWNKGKQQEFADRKVFSSSANFACGCGC